MEPQPLISIIVPVYDAEQYLKRCVMSIALQSYSNLEIILVNDGSKDRSSALCDELSIADDRIRVIHQDNAGVSSARNAGLKVAKGEFITFADSDDILHPQMIERLYKLIRESEADISSCEYTSNEAELSAQDVTTPLSFDAVNGISDMLCNKNITYSVYCKLFSQITVNNVRFHEEYSHHEDLLFCYKAFLNCKKIVHSSEKLYLYYYNEASATRVSFSHKRMTAIDVQDNILKDLQMRYPDSDLIETAVQQYLKVNIYTAQQMVKAGYNSESDFKRIQRNVRMRLCELVCGNLAAGYKLNGLFICFFPSLLRWRVFGTA